ncbi:DUF2630 family protein [Streptomyces sp. 8L]|uniref:DUF2630 family protein n=1 Tax=unclassified Streptomyces TaxID=2593676 RepID=UPI001CD4BB24|nr:DUF2630 family protein [Streptomyces sp. 8L]MCA1221243.1 DUF2630 family protein [Streptomyces sp. 8L]
MSASNDDKGIFHTINGLVDEEHTLRERSTAAQGLAAEERERLRAVEVELDQCWDLLRQRRAKSEYGEDPAEAKVRPASEVEGYQG